MTYAPPSVAINWSIHAICRGIGGITATHHTTGSARTATDAMIDWLNSRDTTTVIDGVAPEIEVWADLSSQQLLTGYERKVNITKGLPADRQVAYTVDALRDWGKSRNWGSGGP
jgi:hypothetical protein